MSYAISYPGAPQCCGHHHTPSKSILETAGASLAAFAAMLSLAVEKGRQRDQLAELPDHLLHDIGVTRRQALNEAEKGIWP